MKTKQVLILALLAVFTIISAFSTARAQGTAFTYQGQLSASGSPASGNYDFTFALFNANSTNTGQQIGDTLTNLDVGVTNGLFIATLDYGAGVFTGSNYWLSISVRTNGGAGFAALNPLQELTPTPYAVFAGSASNLSGALPSADLTGTYGNAVTLNNANNSFTGNGTGLTNVNAATVGGLSASQFWNLTGNAGTTPGVNFVGTKDNEPLQLWANGTRAFLLDGSMNSGQPNVIGGSGQNTITGTYGSTIAGGFSHNIETGANYAAIGGGEENTIQTNAVNSTIAGGQQNSIQSISGNTAINGFIGGGYLNNIQYANYATVVGGWGNSIQTNSDGATIGGGVFNYIQNNAQYSTIAGGWDNSIQSSVYPYNAFYCAIGGGEENVIQSNSFSIIAGGFNNTIEASANYASVGGGSNNSIEIGARTAVIGGGEGNTIQSNAANSTIGGGQQNTIESLEGELAALNGFIGGGYLNNIQFANYATVAGGWGNSIQTNADGSTIGGGEFNYIDNFADNSTIAGGSDNSIQNGFTTGNANYCSIGGGEGNTIQSNNASTIGGGSGNLIEVSADYSFVGGGSGNTIQSNAANAAIAGGQQNSIQSMNGNTALDDFIGGGHLNSIQYANYSTVAGGSGNIIQLGASGSTISGGEFNYIQNFAQFSTIAGGSGNSIQNGLIPNDANYCAIGGGEANIIQSNNNSIIAGGYDNTIQNAANYSSIGGGRDNTIQVDGEYAVIPGGVENVVSGEYGFAAGYQAQALNQGAFVWADSQGVPFASTTSNQFNVRAGGGIRLVTDGAGMTLDGPLTSISFSGSFSGSGANLTNLTLNNASDSAVASGQNNTVNGSIYSVIAGGQNNTLTNVTGSAIAGGVNNTNNGNQSTIGGGSGNVIQIGAYYALLGSGGGNVIGTNSDTAFLGAGYHNLIGANASATVLGGGQYNAISNNATFSVLGGGYQNTNTGPYSVIPGGINNLATTNSFAAGSNALAANASAFVWSDGSATTTSTNANSVTFRAAGGYRLFTSSGAAGVFLGANQTSWSAISDRDAKKNFQPVNAKAVLDKLAAIPIQQWNYKWEKDNDVPNIGPMAQDFKAAFYPGRDDKSISTLEFDGVELAAIQGLNQKLNEKDAELEKLKAKADKVDALEKQLNELKQMVQLLAEKK